MGHAQNDAGVTNSEAFLHQSLGCAARELSSSILRLRSLRSRLPSIVDQVPNGRRHHRRDNDIERIGISIKHPRNHLVGHLISLVDAAHLGMRAGHPLDVQCPPLPYPPRADGVALHRRHQSRPRIGSRSLMIASAVHSLMSR